MRWSSCSTVKRVAETSADTTPLIPLRPRLSTTRLAAWLLATIVAMACSSTSSTPDWSSYEGPGAEHFKKSDIVLPTMKDPGESLNRALFTGNDYLIRYVVDPVLAGYRFVVPGVVRKSIGNFFTNLLFPGRFANNLLQGKLRGAWLETRRFGVNTTVGGLGFWNAADHWEMEASPEDFGQTFAAWGWKNSSYFVMPFFGPSTVRDSVGFVGDTLADPAFYYPPSTWIRIGNELSDEVRGLLDMMGSHYDAYEWSRELYVRTRKAQIENRAADGEGGKAARPFLRPEDRGFGPRAKTRRVDVPGREAPLQYDHWRQPRPAPLVFVLPDIGQFRNGGKTAAVAEILWELGCSVISVSSTWNWDFAEAGLSADQPGVLGRDALDVQRALEIIVRDVERRSPGHATARHLLGVGHGGLTALFIAAETAKPRSEALTYERIVSVNAPRSVERNLRYLDGLADALTGLPPEEQQRLMGSVVDKALVVNMGRLRPAVPARPFNEDEADAVTALSFRNSIRNLVIETQRRRNLGVLKSDLSEDPEAAHAESALFSAMEYVYAFLLTDYAERFEQVTLDEEGAELLFQFGRLDQVAPHLRGAAQVRFVTSAEDELLEEGDLAWIEGLLGEDRVMIAPGDGYLGWLDREALREFLGPALGIAGGDEVSVEVSEPVEAEAVAEGDD